MKHPIVLGLQYGDEGKGKITDSLARQSSWVIRFNGGSNAGHTLWLNGKKMVTHSVPSGVLYPHVKNFIGAGCVIDPRSFAKELKEIASAGSSLGKDRLKVDFRAHLTLPIHVALDAAREGGKKSLGTTRKGIGPTYSTKMDRVGLRVGDLFEPSERKSVGLSMEGFETSLEDKISFLCNTYNALVTAQGLDASSIEENLEAAIEARDVFRDYVSWELTPFYELSKTEKCVLEGAQGALLDLDHGTYPFVTSSNTMAAGASAGTPFPMRGLGNVIGVAKAYMTRVGSGPFQTEQDNEDGERLRAKGGEFGATTGRPRRVGWLNLDELKTAIRLSDCTHLVMTKADVLCEEKEVKLLANGEYRTFKGWDAVYADGDNKKLNSELAAYVDFVEEFIGIPVVGLGTGPDRADFHWRHEVADFWI